MFEYHNKLEEKDTKDYNFNLDNLSEVSQENEQTATKEEMRKDPTLGINSKDGAMDYASYNGEPLIQTSAHELSAYCNQQNAKK